MGNMTVRQIPDEVHDYLRERAKGNGRSLEAEVRAILTNVHVVSKTGGFDQQLRRRFADAGAGVIGDDITAHDGG